VWREVRFLKFSEESESAADIFYPWMAFLTGGAVTVIKKKRYRSWSQRGIIKEKLNPSVVPSRLLRKMIPRVKPTR